MIKSLITKLKNRKYKFIRKLEKDTEDLNVDVFLKELERIK